ncbi:hypothetical protein ACOMHN_034149 [Nucella lapillus]
MNLYSGNGLPRCTGRPLSYQGSGMSPLPPADPFADTTELCYSLNPPLATSEPSPFTSIASRHVDVGSILKPEEPMESEKLVIDLTPNDASSPLSEDQSHEAPPSVLADEFQCQPVPQMGADVPCHLPSATSCSDSETGSQESDMMTGTFRFSLPKNGLANATQPRAKREFVPDNKKDDSYWSKRQKNNVSARMSRYKRKAMQNLLETSVVNLQKENQELKCELQKLKEMIADRLSAEEFSPLSSPTGLTTSLSSLSSGGSVDRSSSSSPTLSADQTTFRQPQHTDEPTLNTVEEDVTEINAQVNESLEQQNRICYAPPSASTIAPPPAHSSKVLYPTTIPPLSAYGPLGEFAPPAAHRSHYDSFPYCAPNGYLPVMNYAAQLHNSTNGEKPAFRNVSSAAACFPAQRVFEENHPWNYSASFSSGNSPGPSSSPGGMTVSEDDSNISTDFRKRTYSDQDEDSQPKMRCPVKLRFKANRDIYYA